MCSFPHFYEFLDGISDFIQLILFLMGYVELFSCVITHSHAHAHAYFAPKNSLQKHYLDRRKIQTVNYIFDAYFIVEKQLGFFSMSNLKNQKYMDE